MSKPVKAPRCEFCGTSMKHYDRARHVITIKLPFGFTMELLRGGKTDFECPNECNIP